MARVPRFLDVSVPLVPGMPAYPGNPEFVVIEGLNLSDAEPGMYELVCLPWRVAGAPARVVLKR